MGLHLGANVSMPNDSIAEYGLVCLDSVRARLSLVETYYEDELELLDDESGAASSTLPGCLTFFMPSA